MAVRVKALDPGCRCCAEPLELVREVARAECPDIESRCVTYPAEIVGRRLFLRTPALVIFDTILAPGHVPSRRDISAWLTPHRVPMEVHP